MKNIKIKKILIVSIIVICTVMTIIVGMPGESPVEKVLWQVLTGIISELHNTNIEAESLDITFPGRIAVKGLKIQKPGNQEPDLKISGLSLDLQFKRIIFCSLIIEKAVFSMPEKSAEKQKFSAGRRFLLPALPSFFCLIKVNDFYAADINHDIVLNAQNISLYLSGHGRNLKASALFPFSDFKTNTLNIQALNLKIKGGIRKNTVELSSMSGQIESALIEGSAFYSPEKGPEGLLRVEGELSVLLKPFLSQNNLDLLSPGRITLDGKAENGKVIISANTEILGGYAEFYADTYAESLMSGTARIIVVGVEISRLQKLFGSEETVQTGRLNAHADVMDLMKIDKRIISVQSEIYDVRYGDRNVPDLKLSGLFKQDSLKFSLVQGANAVKAGIFLYSDRIIRGKMDILLGDLTQPGILVGFQDIEGRLEGTGTIRGTSDKPEAELQLGGFLSWSGLPVDSVRAEFVWMEKQLYIKEFVFSSRIDFSEEIPEILMPMQPAGLLQISGNFAGPVSDLLGDVKASWQKPEFAGFQPDSLATELRLQSNRIELDSFRLFSGSGGIFGQGYFDLYSGSARLNLFPVRNEEGRMVFHAQRHKSGVYGARFDITEWPVESITVMMDSFAEIEGRINGSAEMMQGDAVPDFRLNLKFTEIVWQDADLDSVVIIAEHAKDTLSLNQLTMHKDGLRMSLSAVRSLQDPVKAVFTGRLMLNDAPVKWAQPFFNQPLPDGTVDGYLGFSGSSSNIIPEGKLTFRAPVWQIAPDALPVTENLWELTVQDSILNIRGISGKIQGNSFRLHGYALMHQNSRISGEMGLMLEGKPAARLTAYAGRDTLLVKMHIDSLRLQPAAAFVPELASLDGFITGSFQLSGTPDKPGFAGKLLIDRIAYSQGLYFKPVTKGRVSITFSDTDLILNSVHLPSGNGFLELSGIISNAWNRETPASASLVLKGKQLYAEEKNHWSGEIDSLRVIITGKNDTWTCSGNINLGRSRIITPLNTAVFIRMVNQAQRPAEAPSDFLRNLDLDIRIVNRGNFWLDNNLTRSRLSAALSVSGRAAQPTISGRITAEEGYVLYLDRKFDVARGVIDFADPHRINPILDVEAKSRIHNYQTADGQSYEVNLSLSGTKDQISLSLSSQPPMDELDIVSLLTTGYTRRQLAAESGGNGVTGLIRSRIGELSSQRISGYAARQLGDLLRLDNITIQGNLFQFGSSWGPQLLASKKISGRMSIGYTATLGDMNEQQLRLDYRLAPHISIEGQTDRKGNSGLDLKFWWKFR